MTFFNEYLKDLYESNNQSFLNALISDNVETFIYDVLIVKFDQPFGSETMRVAKQLYKEAQPYIATLKLFGDRL